ncbi:TBC1 domain family member 8B-like isoform X4 [Punica granatum]|uniref:TBC1 domain family member 8B-like isoform X4 n=1 Tax=Punica granatum TaxID=22663 RepID=A0A6P8DMR8_PUNGR|nr:TBC1 domain family member 8B-like isoform X4 [Punica granatum]
MLLSLLSRRSLEIDSRDAYGFALRPQHVQRYREYSNIYKEEEEERSDKWRVFLEQQSESGNLPSLEEEKKEKQPTEVSEQKSNTSPKSVGEGDDTSVEPTTDSSAEGNFEKEVESTKELKARKVQKWANIRPVLGAIENMMSFRVKKIKKMEDERQTLRDGQLPPVEETGPSGGTSEDDNEEEIIVDKVSNGSGKSSTEEVISTKEAPPKSFFSWKEELECLVRGGLPKDLRGELWQAFVGVRTRRMERYYQDLLALEGDSGGGELVDEPSGASKKWRKQIEKDIPRTFPGHPALDEHGRNSLRRLLLAYARHNPSVGYCQAMNFFAGLLLLLMPEENAFWTLVGIIEEYFEGYFTEEMIESQVDQLVFEELMRERFPKLVNHLDYLGVQVAWISGPWFLSIFINMIPWESVLRVWDVILFEGNRVMLFRTALALMELYGPAIVTTKDAGDAITLLQSLAGSTFDSSQLVLTACMGFLAVTEARLQELQEKHRPAVLEVIEERTRKGRVFKDSKGLASKLYSFKHDPEPLIEEKLHKAESEDTPVDADRSHSSNLEEFLAGDDSEVDSVPDLQEQVVWLKVELCTLLEEKRSAVLRAEELETALMELVKQDNRLQLSARVEQLEREVAELRQALADKREQEAQMIQVLMRVEQEQKLTEDARISAEHDLAAQKYAVHVLQEKYEKAMASLGQMEKRVVMAESMLEATLQYESGQNKALSSPRAAVARNQGSSQETPPKRLSILSRPFGLGWRDRNKGKPDEPGSGHSSPLPKETSGQEPEH